MYENENGYFSIDLGSVILCVEMIRFQFDFHFIFICLYFEERWINDQIHRQKQQSNQFKHYFGRIKKKETNSGYHFITFIQQSKKKKK